MALQAVDTGSSPVARSTRQTGDIANAILIVALLKTGYVVLQPIGEGHRYDLVIDVNGIFKRIQVKNGRLRNGAVSFNASSSGGGRKIAPRRDYRGQIDFFGVYCAEVSKCYLIPVTDVGISQVKLRITPSKNNQIKKTINAKQYELLS